MIRGPSPARSARGPPRSGRPSTRPRRVRGRSRTRCAPRGIRRIWVIGNGTSYHSSLHAAGARPPPRRAGRPDRDPGHRRRLPDLPPALGPGDAIVGISASGEFRDVVGVFEEVRGRVPTVGIVHVPGSSLTRVADHVVLSAGGPSGAPVMTKTFSSTLVATILLAAILGDEPLAACAGAPPGRRSRGGGDRRRLAARRGARRRARRRASTCSSSAVASPTRPPSRRRSSSRRWRSSTPRARRPGRWPPGRRRWSARHGGHLARARRDPRAPRSRTCSATAAEWGGRTIEVGPAGLVPTPRCCRPRRRRRGPCPAHRRAAGRAAGVRPRAPARRTTRTNPAGSSGITARASPTSSEPARRSHHDPDRSRRRRQRRVHPEPAGRHPRPSRPCATRDLVLHDIDPDRLAHGGAHGRAGPRAPSERRRRSPATSTGGTPSRTPTS